MKHTSLIVTHYSIFKSYNKPQIIVNKAKELGAEACVLCDINNLSASVEFHTECISNNIKPIIGASISGMKLFAKNYNGWKKLIKIVTKFNTENYLDRSLIDKDILLLTSEVPLCAYPSVKDEVYYRILRSLDLKIKMDALKEDTSNLELKVFDTDIFNEVEQFKITNSPKLPKFAEDEISLLENMVNNGLDKLLEKIPEEKHPIYRKRVLYEMEVIKLANLAGYFLIVQDFVSKARADGQLCSIGRGSAAGSLISYIVGITLIDPIPYGLLFSRFYNAARSFPKHLSFDEYGFVDEWRDFEKKYQ